MRLLRNTILLVALVTVSTTVQAGDVVWDSSQLILDDSSGQEYSIAYAVGDINNDGTQDM